MALYMFIDLKRLVEHGKISRDSRTWLGGMMFILIVTKICRQYL
jgi:hypothetical protein